MAPSVALDEALDKLSGVPEHRHWSSDEHVADSLDWRRSASSKLSGLKEIPLGESTVLLLHGDRVSRSEKVVASGLNTSSSPSSSLICI